MSVTNNQMTLDAKLEFGVWQAFVAKTAHAAKREPLVASNTHDIIITEIQSVVTEIGDGGGDPAGVTVDVGSIATEDLVGTIIISDEITPVVGGMTNGTITAANKTKGYENHDGVRVPAGVPIYGFITEDANNEAEVVIRVSYFLADETTFD